MAATFTRLPDDNLEIRVAFPEAERTRLEQLTDEELGFQILPELEANDDAPLGWGWVSPAEAGIGSNKDMIGYITERDPEDMAALAGTVWWFPEQATIDPYRILLKTGQVVFTYGMEL